MYKKIFIDNKETFYRIHDDGRVMSEKTGRYYKGTIRNGYRWFDLRWEGKKYARSQHRLVAEAFLENPEHLECVHHINNDRLDNRLENLKWVSFSENNLKENKKEKMNDHKDYQVYNESKEEWKTFRDSIYMVSNLGRVKNAKTDKLLQGKITGAGYREYCLTLNGKKQSFRAHKIVWEAWVGTEQMVINHINGNKLDNRLENLENVSNQENTLKAIYDTKIFRFRKKRQKTKKEVDRFKT